MGLWPLASAAFTQTRASITAGCAGTSRPEGGGATAQPGAYSARFGAGHEALAGASSLWGLSAQGRQRRHFD